MLSNRAQYRRGHSTGGSHAAIGAHERARTGTRGVARRPRVVQILATEHWSLLASRSLAYNEAFTRGGMFLTFLSMSFVALALLAQAMSFGDSS